MGNEGYYEKTNRILSKTNELQENLANPDLSSEAKNESARLIEHFNSEFKRHTGMSHEPLQAMAKRK